MSPSRFEPPFAPCAEPHRIRGRRLLSAPLLVLTLAACAGGGEAAPTSQEAPASSVPSSVDVDSVALFRDLRVLAADSMEGRRAGTEGGARAREYIIRRFRELGARPFGNNFEQPFDLPRGADRGVNVIGWLPGSSHPDHYIVMSAHYDHLGVRDGRIYNGADDDASGTVALFQLLRHFREHPPGNSLIFAAFDAEEEGLRGAQAFVADPPVDRSAIVADLNLDMVSRNRAGELWAAGTYHYPDLLPLVQQVAADAPVKLRTGHDRPGQGHDDWTHASDHGRFHDAGIPFIYLGVEDHADYHKPTDDVANIEPGFFVRSVRTIVRVAEAMDRHFSGD